MWKLGQGTRRINPILITLLIVGIIMLVTGGFMLSYYRSGAGAAAPEEAPATQASFHLAELAISPAEANPGEEVAISARVTNTGGAEGSYSAELRIDNIVELVKEVTLPAGGATTLSFYRYSSIPGTYGVTLGELTGQFTVVETCDVTNPEPERPAPRCCG
jgi:hypothetical protein